MNKKDFESYLQMIHAKDYHGVDDDMPDDYEAWLGTLDIFEVIKYAERWGMEVSKESYIRGGQDTLNEVNQLASNPN